MKRVLITGTSSGIGLATAKEFLDQGYEVVGIDKEPQNIYNLWYTHYICDVRNKDELPDIGTFSIIINNAGTISELDAIDTNLCGYINIIEKYATRKTKDIVNVASISGHVGLDTMRYAASQGGRLALTKHLAITLGQRYGTRVNSISPGAVLSGLEPELYQDTELLEAVANESILKKWIQPEEIAKWIYFVAVVNKSMTGQDILIDNGEVANYNFISSGSR
nr:MAG TPA: 3-ketoacyl-ACP reductase [Caudoviricetes sp.]